MANCRTPKNCIELQEKLTSLLFDVATCRAMLFSACLYCKLQKILIVITMSLLGLNSQCYIVHVHVIVHWFLSVLVCVLFNIFRYASLLLVITASMSNKLEDAPFFSRVIKRRPLLKLSTCTGKQHGGFSPLNPSDMPEIFKLFQSSFFIIPSMLPLWLQALNYFIQRRYVRAVCPLI